MAELYNVAPNHISKPPANLRNSMNGAAWGATDSAALRTLRRDIRSGSMDHTNSSVRLLNREDLTKSPISPNKRQNILKEWYKKSMFDMSINENSMFIQC